MNKAGACRTAMAVLAIGGALAARATTFYVALDNPTPEHPFTNWAMAGTNLLEVVNTAMTNGNGHTVLVSNGLYVLTNQIEITNRLSLASVNGRTKTILDGNRGVTSNRCAYLRHYQSILSGFTVSNGGSDTIEGGGVRCENGTVNDCTITLNIGLNGAGVFMEAGTLTNCLIFTNMLNAACSFGTGGGGVMTRFNNASVIANCQIVSNYAYRTGGLHARSPVVIRDCVIAYNYCWASDAGGVYLYSDGGNKVMERCEVYGNRAGNYCGGVYIHLGAVSNCVIFNNSAPSYAGGCYLAGDGILCNSLVYSNRLTSGSSLNRGGGVCAVGGSILNCTLAANRDVSGYNGLSCTNATKTVPVVNTIIVSNSVYDGVIQAAFSNCCLESTAGLNATDCLTDNPRFVNYAAGNFRLRPASPCVDRGLFMDWMTGAPDLDGGPRIRHGAVDLGPYELLKIAGAIFTGR